MGKQSAVLAPCSALAKAQWLAGPTSPQQPARAPCCLWNLPPVALGALEAPAKWELRSACGHEIPAVPGQPLPCQNVLALVGDQHPPRGGLAQLKPRGPQGGPDHPGPDGQDGARTPPIQVAHPAAPFPTLQSPHRLPVMSPWEHGTPWT